MSKITEEVIAIERGFWIRSNDPQYFAEHPADDGVTVIEPMGFTEKPLAGQAPTPGEPFRACEPAGLNLPRARPAGVTVRSAFGK